MGKEKIHSLLLELRAEMERNELDTEELRLLNDFDQELDKLLASENHSIGKGSLLENARELEVDFTVKHPAIMRYLNEIMETLGKMGI